MDDRLITVLHVCEHFGNRQTSFHGVARVFELWIPAFDPRRFRVLLCSRQGPVKPAEDRLIAAGIHPFYLGYGKTDPRNLFKLMRLIRREKVDILHAHGYGACLWSRLAGHWLKIPVIVNEHCNYGTVPLYQRPIERILGPMTRYAIATSESVRKFTVEKRYIPAPVVQLLYNGIPLDQFRKADSTWIRALRREQGHSPGDRVLGIVGRLESHKGHLDAFRALQLMLKQRSDLFLWLVGDGRYEDVLRQWVARNNMTDRIRFLGYRADVVDVIQCFDIQIFPSHAEATPYTLFEAMAVGNLPVASTADGQGEILEHEKTALLFEPGDAAKMAELTLRLLNDPGLQDRLRNHVLQRIRDFDMRRTIAAVEHTYERMMLESRTSSIRRL